MFRVTVGILTLVLVSFSHAFNIEDFLSKCSQRDRPYGRVVECKNFQFSDRDVNDIQNQKFTISPVAAHVYLKDCNLGVLNTNFFSKFPECVNFQITNCTFGMDSSSSVNFESKITFLQFSENKVRNNLGSNALASLKHLQIFHSYVTVYETPRIDNYFFQSNSKIEKLIYFFSNIEEIDSDALVGLPSLTTLNFVQNKIRKLNPNTINRNVNLKFIYLAGNKFTAIPDYFFPYSAVEIGLQDALIKSVDGLTFKNLTSLKNLYLTYTRDCAISCNAFDDLLSLEVLDLSNRKDDNYSRHNFWNLANLIELNLGLNEINELPDNIFDDLHNLQKLSLNFNNLQTLKRRTFENLKELTYLNLSRNNITYLPPDVFDDMPKLTNIQLEGNPIADKNK